MSDRKAYMRAYIKKWRAAHPGYWRKHNTQCLSKKASKDEFRRRLAESV
jgi:hypothetical protein